MTRPKLVAVVRETAASSTASTLDLQDFLLVARQCVEIVETDRLKREQAAILKTEFTPLQVSEFRGEFLGPSERTELRFDDVRSMLQRVMPLKARHTAELSHEYLKALASEDVVRNGTMEFPEFLMFMRNLIDMDLIECMLGT